MHVGVITVRAPPVSRVVSANGFAFFECNTTAQHNSWRVDGKAVVSDHQYILGLARQLYIHIIGMHKHMHCAQRLDFPLDI